MTNLPTLCLCLISTLIANVASAAEATFRLPEPEIIAVDLGSPVPQEVEGNPKHVTLDADTAAVLRWNPALFERLLQEPDDLRDLALVAHVKQPKGASGGELRVHVVADADAVAVPEAPPVSTLAVGADGEQRIRLQGLTAARTALLVLSWSGDQALDVMLRGRDTTPTAEVTILDRPAHAVFERDNPIRDGVYCQVVDGHLTYGGERLRLWGTLGHGSKRRMRDLGFNGYRLWNRGFWDRMDDAADIGMRGELPPSTKGDGGNVDTLDRAVAELRELGIFIMGTQLMKNWIPGADRPGSFMDDGGDFDAWRAAIAASGLNPEKLGHYVAPVDARFARIHEHHCSLLLNRVNPYTGRSYAEEEAFVIQELANEDRTVNALLDGKLHELPPYFRDQWRRAWVAWLRAEYGDDAGLRAAWGELPAGEGLDGELALQPVPKQRKHYPVRRAFDLERFVVETQVGYLDRIRDHCRSHAPEGVGVAVVPFSYDTMYRPHLRWAYLISRGDVMNFGMYHWSWDSGLTRPPGMYVMDAYTVDDKPTVIYETNRGRPSPFRAEYPYELAAFAAWQDWDAIFFHYWGGPDAEVDEEYLVQDVMNGHDHHFWTAVHHASDPSMSSAMAVAGHAFRSGALAPAADPAIYTIGARGFLGSEGPYGFQESRHGAFERGSRLRFEPESDHVVERPEGVATEPPTAAIASGDEILWDWPNGRLVVDTPTAKFLVGRTAVHTFADGLTLSGFDVPWAAVGVVSLDGRPLADGCRRAAVSAVADAQNTGFEIDLSKDMGGPHNQIKARISHGDAPVIEDPVGFTLSFPSAASGELVVLDFARRIRARPALVDGAVRVVGPMFLGDLHLASRGAKRDPVVDPLRVAGVETERVEADDDRLAGIWFPVPGIHWGSAPLSAAAGLSQAGWTPRHEQGRVVVDDGELLLPGTSRVELRYTDGAIAGVSVVPVSPPEWADAVAHLSAELGAPERNAPAAQFDTSIAEWTFTREGAGFRLELTAAQGRMQLQLTRR